MGCCDTEGQAELPVTSVTSDKSWTPALSMEKFPDSADLQPWFKWLRERSVRSPGQWKWALPLFSSVVLSVMHRRQAAWDT